MNLRQPEAVQRLRCHEEEWIARRVGLMLRDVELPNAEREVDLVEIFERRRKKRQVQREEQPTKNRAGEAMRAGHAGRSSRPSLRLPMR